jgi:hypothetical protein
VLSLAAWYADVLRRHDQLTAWTNGPVALPHSVWLSGLFNPKAFLTAVMQTHARALRLPLDVMRFVTDVTNKTVDQVGFVFLGGGEAWWSGVGCFLDQGRGAAAAIACIFQFPSLALTTN